MVSLVLCTFEVSRSHMQQESQWSFYNPLPEALAHYEEELIATLQTAGVVVGRMKATPVEGVTGLRKATSALRALGERLALALSAPSIERIIVLWPAFGYFDGLSWLLASIARDITIIIHDVRPLRPQFGYGALALRSCRIAGKSARVRYVCHTEAAARELLELTGISAKVVLHPVMAVSSEVAFTEEAATIRVLGQFKSARDVGILERIARDDRLSHFRLQIWGRGWPAVAGWEVHDLFVPEADFRRLIQGAAGVIIPYQHFYQSGVMVRALEALVPVICVRHPQLVELYGADYPGIVDDTSADGWLASIAEAVSVSKQSMQYRLARALERCSETWTDLLGEVSRTRC
ncbi:hypothetical protein QDR37_03480 [Amnibacterium sp. CER49]|uniref:hypothetical protein n=1 Tax=Amnibacterium sp. CER49 TaxID=3039161 RepID=UPI00244B24DD|nr:hypothetical protein [Amnibacterium sp. CER49]MDH2443001.1 hypothetical protein [Amnibacterium sp. CER49]